MTAFKALIVPFHGTPDNELPDTGEGGEIDNTLPGGRPGHPSFGPIVPPHGPWPGFPVRPWVPSFPTPPIVIPPDPEIGNDLPIVLPPGSPGNALPVTPGRPANPIVLPPMPEGQAALALVWPIQTAEPKAPPEGVPAGSRAALIYFGPGTVPMIAWIAPAATPK
jgi:hypothetical protein